MSDTIFNSNTVQTPEQNTNTDTSSSVNSNNSFADLLGSIKNERGEPKYRDLPTALEALRHSQEFIPQLRSEKERLEQELAEARKEAERLRVVEETVNRFTSAQESGVQKPQPVGLDAEAVANLVSQTLTQREIEAQRKANLSSVVNSLQQSLGEDAEKIFYSKAKELGMSPETINSLAAQSPVAVLQLFGVSQSASPQTQKTNVTPNTSTVNTAGYQPQLQSFIGRNTKPIIIGATTSELMEEHQNSKQLVEELHGKGLTTYDLTDPKTYFKQFGR